MLSPDIENAMNTQIAAELYSSHLYLAMSAYCEEQALPGFARWFKIQSDEEREHALKFVRHVVDRGGQAEQPADGPATCPVATLVERDARQPGGHRACGIIARERAMSRDEGLLDEVERLVGIRHVGQHKAVHGSSMSPHDFGERPVAVRAADQGELPVGQGRQVDVHRCSAVNALATALSNLAA